MIGIFDSGVGGLTVARAIKKRFPESKIVYFGDTARVPWGNKSPEIVREYSDQICDFLISKGVTEIVIACNTASAFAGDYLKEKYNEVKIYDVITPVIERISSDNLSKDSKIAVIGTRGTVSSGAYEKKMREAGLELEIVSKACPLFVPLVEEGWSGTEVSKMVIAEYLKEFKGMGIGRIILGCTHYPILKESISEYFEGLVDCIGSDEEIAKRISPESNGGDGDDEFFFSDLSETYLELAGNIYGSEIRAQKIEL